MADVPTWVERPGASVKQFQGTLRARDHDGAGVAAAGAFVGLLDERGAHAHEAFRLQDRLRAARAIGVCTPTR
jgi:hypothetical protein